MRRLVCWAWLIGFVAVLTIAARFAGVWALVAAVAAVGIVWMIVTLNEGP